MYKILIVDDETWIRKGIISKLSYHEFEFLKIFEVENGYDALKIIEEEEPNIIITDIKMPVLDGIELIRQTINKFKEIKFIIVSGYADFAYAEQAINMGVNGYILKPIQDKNLVETLQKVIKELDAKSDIRRIIDKKKKLEKDNQYLILEQKLNQILHTVNKISVNKEETSFIDILKTYKHNYFLLALVNIDSINFYQFDYKENDINLIKASIKTIIEQANINCKYYVVDNYNNKKQVLILFMDQQRETLLKETNRLLFEIFDNIKNELKLSITVGVSKPEQKITSCLYEQAKKALNLKLIHGSQSIYVYKDLEKNDTFLFPNEKIKLLYKCIERHEVNNMEIILKEIFAYENFKNGSSVHVRYVWLEIASMIIKFCSKFNFKSVRALELALLGEEIFEKFDSLEGLTKYLYTTIIDVLKLEKSIDINTKDIIIKAQKYIDKHYDEDITVKELAYKLAINPNYLSTLFKKKVGKSFTKYLKEKRIKSACKLLLETKASVAQISQSIGYQDPQYFYRVFKKNTGMTPLSYRNKLKK